MFCFRKKRKTLKTLKNVLIKKSYVSKNQKSLKGPVENSKHLMFMFWNSQTMLNNCYVSLGLAVCFNKMNKKTRSILFFFCFFCKLFSAQCFGLRQYHCRDSIFYYLYYNWVCPLHVFKKNWLKLIWAPFTILARTVKRWKENNAAAQLLSSSGKVD